MIFLLKSPLQCAKIIFQSKDIPISMPRFLHASQPDTTVILATFYIILRTVAD